MQTELACVRISPAHQLSAQHHTADYPCSIKHKSLDMVATDKLKPITIHKYHILCANPPFHVLIFVYLCNIEYLYPEHWYTLFQKLSLYLPYQNSRMLSVSQLTMRDFGIPPDLVQIIKGFPSMMLMAIQRLGCFTWTACIHFFL